MICKRTTVLAVIMTHGMIAMLNTISRRGPTATSLLVRAFTTTTTTPTSTVLQLDGTSRARASTHRRPAGTTFHQQAASASFTQHLLSRFLSTSTTVEEDLDAALDTILGDMGKVEKVHMNGAKPMPKTFIEQVRYRHIEWIVSCTMVLFVFCPIRFVCMRVVMDDRRRLYRLCIADAFTWKLPRQQVA